ncbi:MAG: HepT-like ribonuclease domain-containing protein [bacterium]
MIKNDTVRLHHILDAAQEAVALYRSSHSCADLSTQRMLSLSLVRLLEIVGEAARGVSPAFREAHPDIAWKKMIGMRDRLIHGYFDVNLDMVRETVIEDLPFLIAQLEKVMALQNE